MKRMILILAVMTLTLSPLALSQEATILPVDPEILPENPDEGEEEEDTENPATIPPTASPGLNFEASPGNDVGSGGGCLIQSLR